MIENIPSQEGEVWESLNDFPWLFISNHGRVYSSEYYDKSIRFRKTCVSPNTGYCMLTINHKSRSYARSVHRLVAVHHVPNPLNKPFVNHKDGNKLNNHSVNLEWVTRRENVDHAMELGLLRSGEDNTVSKLKNDDVLKIRTLSKDGYSGQAIAEMYGVNRSTVNRILSGERWKHVI